MKPIILMGTGEASRKIIKSLEACSGIRVRYLCDFKTVRVGIKIGGIEVISVEKMVEISKEYDVILANFKDEIAWKKITEENHIDYFVWKENDKKSYFYRKEFLIGQDEFLLDKWENDYDLKKIVYDRGMGKYPIYRMDCYDVVNASLMELCKNGNKEGFDKWTSDYYEQLGRKKFLDTFFYVRPTLRLICNIIKKNAHRGSKVCDIACGNGELAINLCNEGFETYAIDIDTSKIEYLKSKNINAYRGTVEKTPFKSDYMDIVIASEILEHVYNPLEVIKEIYRILKPKGRCYISVPYMRNCDCQTHVRQFDITDIYTLVVNNGFEVENVILVPYINSSYLDNIFICIVKNK